MYKGLEHLLLWLLRVIFSKRPQMLVKNIVIVFRTRLGGMKIAYDELFHHKFQKETILITKYQSICEREFSYYNNCQQKMIRNGTRLATTNSDRG